MATDEPTDPDDIDLYRRYGPNWRSIIGSGMRDRGGRYDRNMRFNHGVPSGFLTRPTSPQAFMPQPAIDTGVYEKYRMEYDRLMAEYNSLMNQYYQSFNQDPYSDYERQQQYYEDNFNAAYGQGNSNSSQTNQYDPGQVVGGTITTSTAGQGLNLGGSGGGLPASKLMSNQSATRGGDSLFGGNGSERAASAAAAAAPTQMMRSAPAGPTPTNQFFNYTAPVVPTPTNPFFNYTAPAYTPPAASTVLAPRGGDSLFGGYGSATKPAAAKKVTTAKKVRAI